MYLVVEDERYIYLRIIVSIGVWREIGLRYYQALSFLARDLVAHTAIAEVVHVRTSIAHYQFDHSARGDATSC